MEIPTPAPRAQAYWRRLLRVFSNCALVVVALLLGPLPSALAEPVLVKLDTPRDTLRTFMTAMNDYRRGVATQDEKLQSRILDAVRCLNLNQTPYMLQRDIGRELAIYLKEFIDRKIVIRYDLVPDDTGTKENPLLRWRLKNTEVTIALVQTGDRAGEYLFSPDTVYRAKDFFEQVQHQPYLSGSGRGALYQAPWSDQFIPTWAHAEYVGLQLWQWLAMVLAIFLGLLVQMVTKFFIRLMCRVSAQVPENSWRYWKFRLLRDTESPLGLMAATAFWVFAIILLRLDGKALLWVSHINQLVFSAATIWLLYKLADVLAVYLKILAARSDFPLDDQLVPILTKSAKVILVVFGVLLSVQGLGFNIMSLLAGLGLGGLALALAAKDTAANFFGSLMIFLDRPFRVGDQIVSGKDEGTVEQIGFRSTRLRTFYNSLISIPNSSLANQTIDNMGMRRYRRIRTYFGITYDTPPEKIEAFLEGIKNIVLANPSTVKEDIHVAFSGFGESELRVLLSCFLDSPDWAHELNARQNIFLEILRLARALKIEFAYPTRTLHIDDFPEKQSRVPTHGESHEELGELARKFSEKGEWSRPTGLGLFSPPYNPPPPRDPTE